MQTYIQEQRKAAALKAQAEYEKWALAEVARRNDLINRVHGPAQVQMMAVLSSDPPVPPPEFLQAVQLGMTLNDSQAGTFVAVTEQAATVLSAAEGAGQVALQGSLYYLGLSWEIRGTYSANGLAASLGKLGKKIFPHAARSAMRLTQRALSTGVQMVGVAGAVLEVVANIVQIGVTADAYKKAADYNTAFREAVIDANEPLSVADLKAMVNDDPARTLNYVTAYMATGPASSWQSVDIDRPTMTLDAIVSITARNR
jgi:hypothetical protein